MQLKWSIRVLFALLMFFLHDVAAAQTLKIPYESISGFQAPLYLGERAGLFKKNQLEAQLIYMPGGSLIVQTLLSNEVGVASLAPPSAVAAWVKGAELSLVAGGIERALNVLMVNPKIKKVEDLKGKRVAISRFGSLSDVSLRDALAFHKAESQSRRCGSADRRPRRAHGGAHLRGRRRRDSQRRSSFPSRETGLSDLDRSAQVAVDLFDPGHRRQQ